MSMRTFSEYQTVPVGWALVVNAIGMSVAVALALYFPPMAALAVLVGTAIALNTGLVAFSRTRIRVDADGLWVGRNHLDTAHLGPALALDRAATADRLGVRADARAALFTKPFLSQTVEVAVDDAEDPHPYWLIGTRQPHRLAAAINDLRAGR